MALKTTKDKEGSENQSGLKNRTVHERERESERQQAYIKHKKTQKKHKGRGNE